MDGGGMSGGGVLRFILGDQLTRDLPILRQADKARDVILMAEVFQEASTVRHHKQKIIFVFSAMRHFADSLRAEGFHVDYVKLDDAGNSGSLGGELERALQRHAVQRICVTEPSEWRVAQDMKSWPQAAALDILPDDRFIATPAEFKAWAQERKQLRMEFFYRVMRQKTGYLMTGDAPVGGAWNLDAENRKKLPADATPPPPLRFAADATTRAVADLVEQRFGGHFGTAGGFNWAVTRAEALQALDHFIAHSLAQFGDYQDAMTVKADFVFHSLLSPYLNFGLLRPREVCEAALKAFAAGKAPLNAVEGYIRQIIGWREFVRGLYWFAMPGYAGSNYLAAGRKLPWFYWTGKTAMNCMGHCLRNTMDHAYAHHIQRLMVLGNFALLAGVKPAEIEEWFLAVYADALEWVELPNVHGMVMHADGGLLGSKPYAASGAYINRMSDYCAGCSYDPKLKSGPKACPFNYLYWNFLIENEAKLGANIRMAMPYQNLRKMSADVKRQYQSDAQRFLAGLD